MKKAISLLVALAATASTLSLATFAADDIPGTAYRSATAYEEPAPRISLVGTNETPEVGAHELFLVDSTDSVVGGVYNHLVPDTEYKFRIYWNDSANVLYPGTTASPTQLHELNGKDLDNGTIRLRTVKGSSAIQSARINTVGRGDASRYELVITTRAAYGTKLTDVEYSLTVTGSKSGTFKESGHIFEVGHATINDDETNVGEDGYITISNDYPVITKEQFVDIAKSANYKNVNFEAEDGGWMFTGRVSGMSDSTFHYTYNVIPELINKFPDQEYKFLTFNAGVTFPASGEMRIDVSDIYDSFDNMYTYLYRNGKLTAIDSTYDSGANEVVFRTNYLGSFVITDTRITDTSIINNNEEEEELDEEEDEDREDGHGNPNTGAAAPAMNLVVALGLASLVTAGAVSRKRK